VRSHDGRRSRFVYLLALALLLSGGAAAQWLAPFDETDQMVRVFEDRLMFYLMKGLVYEHHLPRDNVGHLPDTSAVVYILGGMQEPGSRGRIVPTEDEAKTRRRNRTGTRDGAFQIPPTRWTEPKMTW